MYTVDCTIKNDFGETESSKTIQAANRATAHRRAYNWFHTAFVGKDEITKRVNQVDASIESWEYRP